MITNIFEKLIYKCILNISTNGTFKILPLYEVNIDFDKAKPGNRTKTDRKRTICIHLWRYIKKWEKCQQNLKRLYYILNTNLQTIFYKLCI